MPEFLERPNVLGIGEIGLNKNTRNEVTTLLGLIDLGLRHQRADPLPHAAPGGQVQGHADDPRPARGPTAAWIRSRVCIDHCEEHTIRLALDEGYWAGITLYPTTKATPERAADMVEMLRPGADPGQLLGRLGAFRPAAVPSSSP